MFTLRKECNVNAQKVLPYRKNASSLQSSVFCIIIQVSDFYILPQKVSLEKALYANCHFSLPEVRIHSTSDITKAKMPLQREHSSEAVLFCVETMQTKQKEGRQGELRTRD